ncbi:MAG: hypothetical protein WEB88_11190 [Gemmatimonadota bacterium]
MTRFAAVLQRVEARLTVPQPTRACILHEMAADLEDLYAAYRARGLAEADALRRAEAALGASPEAVEALVQVHRPAWERLLARFSDGSRHRVERGLLTGITLVGMLVGANALAGQGILNDASPFLWPVLLLAAGTLAVTGAVFFRLVVKQDHRPGSLRAGLMPLMVLAAAAVLVGGFGWVWEMSRIADDVNRLGNMSADMLLPRLRRASEVFALGLTSGLGGVLAWFHLRRRALAVERAEAGQPVPATHSNPTGGVP